MASADAIAENVTSDCYGRNLTTKRPSKITFHASAFSPLTASSPVGESGMPPSPADRFIPTRRGTSRLNFDMVSPREQAGLGLHGGDGKGFGECFDDDGMSPSSTVRGARFSSNSHAHSANSHASSSTTVMTPTRLVDRSARKWRCRPTQALFECRKEYHSRLAASLLDSSSPENQRTLSFWQVTGSSCVLGNARFGDRAKVLGLHLCV